MHLTQRTLSPLYNLRYYCYGLADLEMWIFFQIWRVEVLKYICGVAWMWMKLTALAEIPKKTCEVLDQSPSKEEIESRVGPREPTAILLEFLQE